MLLDSGILKDMNICAIFRRTPIERIDRGSLFTEIVPIDKTVAHTFFYNNEKLAAIDPTTIATVDLCIDPVMQRDMVSYDDNIIISAKFDNAGNVHDFTYGRVWDNVCASMQWPNECVSYQEFERTYGLAFKAAPEIVKEFVYRMSASGPEDVSEIAMYMKSYLDAYDVLHEADSKKQIESVLVHRWATHDDKTKADEVWYAPAVVYKLSQEQMTNPKLNIVGLVLYVFNQYYKNFSEAFGIK